MYLFLFRRTHQDREQFLTFSVIFRFHIYYNREKAAKEHDQLMHKVIRKGFHQGTAGTDRSFDNKNMNSIWKGCGSIRTKQWKAGYL